MDLSGAPAHVRLNMKRSPLESHIERQRQRRVIKNLDGDEVMIGEIQVNEVVEHPWSEVSTTEFHDWQQREYVEKLTELQITCTEFQALMHDNSFVQFGLGTGSVGQITNN